MTEAAQQQPSISGPQYLRLIGLGALIGIPAALLAAVFLAVIHELEDWLWHDLPDALGYDAPPWFLVVALPVAGAALVFAARRLLPGDGGHRPLDGFGASSPTPVSYAPGVALAAIGTLAFGAVLGPEAPLIALGSAVGLAVTHFVDVDPAHHQVLAMAGAFSAISALFGGPIAAGILLIEAGIGLGKLLIPLMIPGLVAAAVGYLLFTGFGNWGGLEETTLSVPGLPPYEGVEVGDLAVAVVAGILIALVAQVCFALARRVAAGEERLGMGRLLLAGGLAVGLIALLADALGEDSQDVLFSGQTAIPALVAETSAGAVAVLLAAKGLAYAICLGCGFRGGQVFPAIFLGIGVVMFAVIAFDVSPTLAVAAGTAAGSAAVTRLLFASIVIGSLLVGSAGADAVPAAILAGVAAWVTVMALERAPRRRAATAE
ncbi:MAG TPA: chloride channel protein [Gaiellaceae bacterium]|nr:chloride channel protein [Gaiellaceae bacterium]